MEFRLDLLCGARPRETVAEVVGQVLADGTVFIHSGQPGVGWITCGGVTAVAVSALAEDGATTVTDTTASPC